MDAFPKRPRAETNPLFNANRLKLGVFGINGPGTVMTNHPDRFLPTWDASLRVAETVDRAGLEAIVPYSRWKPFGPADHATGYVLDTLTWAAALAVATRHSAIFATVHAHAVHPLAAAKQGATIDRISGGRFALNFVVGFYTPEIETFGAIAGDHDQRYAMGEEWITAVERLWTEAEEVDVDGTYVKVRGGVSNPKPLQAPMPPIMNAGSSERGRRLAACHADLAFIVSHNSDPQALSNQVGAYKQYAREAFEREIMVWGYALVVLAASRAAAEAKLDEYTEDYPDETGVDVFVQAQVKNSGPMPPEALAGFKAAVASGGGVKLVGTPEDVADGLCMLSSCGFDGILLTFVDYEGGSADFVASVLPILEARGLRAPFTPPA
jgi:alkanesulfonate monooxygenase SsuD/methylene tetrahydromethanopterin reductase-like flavin-dependent oxidoreductase (luciferase family)